MDPVFLLRVGTLTTVGNLEGRMAYVPDGGSTIGLFVPHSAIHADEICQLRLDNQELRATPILTYDFPLYAVKGGQPVLLIPRYENSPVFKRAGGAIWKPDDHKNLWFSPDDLEAAELAPGTCSVSVAELDLEGDSAEWGFLRIDTERYDRSHQEGGFNRQQRTLVERIFRSGDEFRSSMGMVQEANHDYSVMLVLKPRYVLQKVGQTGNVIARASVLYDVGSRGSGFVAIAEMRNIKSLLRN
jgi:hypothetical protein